MSYRLQVPWTDSPFFQDLCDGSLGLSKEELQEAREYHELGYITMDLNLDDEFIERLKVAVNAAPKAQEEGYHYSDSPRVFEAWRTSHEVIGLATNPKVLSKLRMLYQREPIPFQTINFIKGSNQPLHSDVIHFHSVPERFMCGVWVALEDMDCFNGTLSYVPGSHKLPVYDFQSLGLPKAEYGKQFKSYAIYEEFIKDLVVARGLKVKNAYIKKGQAILWNGNLIHGGSKVLDPERTRWSQATHYFFKGCEHYYSPMFSSPSAGEYSEKDLSTKDILNWKI